MNNFLDSSTNKVLSKINYYINKLDLNLSGYDVLTEVGSNLYNYMPIIPLLAGANNVMAWTRDSKYGKTDDIIAECKMTLDKVNYINSVNFFEETLNKNHLKQADIITNSNFLRPLNEEKLKHVRKTAVIPLMYESWEIREEDIDIEYCTRKKIKVAGTNENYKDIKIFEHIGYLALKMAFEAGYEIFNNNIIIWSDDNFGDEIERTFNKLAPKKIVKTTNFAVLKKYMKEVDFIFICDYSEMREYLTPEFFNLDELSKINNEFGIIHLYGNIRYNNRNNQIPLYPQKNGEAKKMSFTLSHIGLNPFIALQVAGFKVAELMIRNTVDSKLMQPINF